MLFSDRTVRFDGCVNSATWSFRFGRVILDKGIASGAALGYNGKG